MHLDVWHKWRSGAQFILNCYCYRITLVVHNLEESGYFLHSKEGVTQRDPLSMITYGKDVFPIIREIWYAPPLGHSAMEYWLRGGRRKLWATTWNILVPAYQGGTTVLLPRIDQEYLGHRPTARGHSIWLLSGNVYNRGHWESLPWQIYRRTVGRGHLVGQEGAGKGRVGEDTAGCVPQAPAVRLHWTAEDTPTGMGFFAAGHPRHMGCLHTSQSGSQGKYNSGPLPGRRRGCPGAGGHLPASETGGFGSPRPKNNGHREMDGFLCNHRTSCHRTQGKVVGKDEIPCHIS